MLQGFFFKGECMLAHCNQNCNTTQEIKINPKTKKPICVNCNKEVTGMSSFAIRSMINAKDFIEKKKQAFSFHCKECNEQQQGFLAPNKKYVKCSVCSKKMDVTEHMLSTLKMLLKNKE